ncbi:permease of the major facilitator superfamily [Xylona heveae TC161]|uniref:Permease of the major facilitator superfamily n=1 Tax=Xylona heveae (strain CBS 132557 / TC161) TaxID=1328760 RepID=A0A164ZIW1_XYLHT|nr:permease of the major facilitator superfamily [Xylona heveae TC161]KZF19152.1 permease of the major facilitator superfamily [Xylona heveae TC161]
MAEEKKINQTVDAELSKSNESIAEGVVVEEKYADETLRLVQEYGDSFGPLTPEADRKLRWKLYRWIMGFVLVINLMLFIDKATLAYSSLLGLFQEVHITDQQYDNLNTIFYTAYLVAQWPGHYLMQRLPFGKFVAGTVFTWSILIFLHCTATNYGGLIALRFFLGATESILVPAMEITMGMFFIKEEQAIVQPLFWITCMGCNIPAGFVAYGLLYSKSHILPWKFFMIITGGITLFLAIACFIWYPNNPAQARFLTLEERVHATRRVHESNRGAIEQKQFKKSQFIEAIRDPLTWLFGLQSFALMIANNLAYQQNLLFLGIGVSNLGSTLVGVAGSGFSVVCCIIAAFLIRRFPNNNAYFGVWWCIPAIVGAIVVVTLPWSNRVGILAGILLAGGTFGITYIIALGWTTSSASGYTKKLTRNVLFMVGYGIANIISPQIWRQKDGPRYYSAWIVQIVISWVGCPVILLIIRFILARRNVERRKWIAEQEAQGHHGEGYVEELDESGNLVKKKVDIALLDLTDLQNKYFIYPL